MIKKFFALKNNITHNIIAVILLVFLVGCSDPPISYPTPSLSPVIPTVTSTIIPTITTTPTNTPIQPQTLVFYGDSSLAIGDAGDGREHVGFSFVSNLQPMLDSIFTLITANYGGRTAKWAYEHLEENALIYEPNIVTLWWGFDDMGGCPGTFDRETNKFILNKAEAIITEHIRYLNQIIETLLAQNIPTFVLTPIPANGWLQWSHLEDYQIVWEEGRWCDFNQGLQLLAQAQRDLVSQYSSSGNPVFLVDVWQIYMDNPGMEKMYMDVVHPASNGAKLIAERWLEVYEENIR